MLKKFWRDEEGASMTEYVLLIALIGLAAFVVVKTFGARIQALFTQASQSVDSAAKEIKK